jgi:dTDP-4-amino-4,6-dideoxygalactose transaminase
MKKILFNNIGKSKNYLKHVEHLFSDYDLIRGKHFSNLCIKELQPHFPNAQLLLTHSATGALEIIAHLLDIKEGDEIILPSYTFVSTVNAFASRGATPVFVDIEPGGLNLNLDIVEQAITSKTKAIVAVHYAGHSCDLIRLKLICQKHSLILVEDAAMAFGNTFEGKQLGGIGDFGVISFDVTKQVSAIQGGLLIVNNEKYKIRANNIYHIGTNRADFTKGVVPYYEWVDVGSKYQMNELNAAFLYEQLLILDEIIEKRKSISKHYFSGLKSLSEKGHISIMNELLVDSNIHEFYVIEKSEKDRQNLSSFLKVNGVESMFHYIPLHSAKQGIKIGRFIGSDETQKASEQLLRLPMHDELTSDDVDYIIEIIRKYYED